MITLDNKIKDIILSSIPMEYTDAIYIFGSYGTEYYDEETSDIDIAWFPNKKIEYEELASLEFDLVENLKREVDLVIPDKSNILFLKEVLSRPPICINSEEFSEWLDRFNDWILDEYRFIQNVVDERLGKYD